MRIHKSTALRVTLIYAIVSAVWILLSDAFVSLAFNNEMQLIISISKGYLFILITATMLYILIRNSVSTIIKTEAQLSLIFDSVDDGIHIFRVNPDNSIGNYLNINEAAVKRLGYLKLEIMNMTPLQIIKHDLLPETIEWYRILIEKGSVVYESIHVAKNGKEIPVEISSRILFVDNIMIGASIVRDITIRKQEEKLRREAELSIERDKRRFYRETILAVTDGKFELGEPEDIAYWLESPLLTLKVSSAKMMSYVRQELMEFCRLSGMPQFEADDYELAIGEAIGNAVKHAGEGEVLAGVKNRIIWVAVVDHGSGIDTFSLPKVARLSGFTTKASMGLGYTMILKVCDHVKLATGPTGTTVYMEKGLDHMEDVDRRIGVHSAVQWPIDLNL
ncbi:MAG: PAS domain S-box protein [Armatimonadota bacterium]